ncbi:putative ABC transporter permease [Pyxidicoccus fallax]|uniref:putative ABC transporter permease n=1 Tax=Pyxidicoccus fallax TaxID=394095 RepID=UPI003FCCFEBB
MLEVLFTGAGSALKRDRSATAKTYLWMHPIYGGTALALEEVSARLKPLPRPVRALAYTALIFAAEYGTGWFLKRLLGRCPWDYSPHRWSVHGLIRLDYAPAWYLTALLFEPVRDTLLHVTSEALTQTPEYRRAEEAGILPEGALPEGEPEEAGVVARRFELAHAESASLH